MRGHGSIGSMEVGNFFSQSRGPVGVGHDPLTAPDVLTVNLEGRATLDTRFDVKDGSTLTASGGDGSSVNAGASTIEGDAVAILAPLAGQGTVLMTNGLNSLEGFTDAGRLDLGGPVGAGETIGINAGTLAIDTLNIDGHGGSHTVEQGVLLKGLAASSYGFNNAAHTLTLFDGDAVLDTIQFSQGTTSDSFRMGQYAFIDVLQTDGGVCLRGSYNFTRETEIPLHGALAAV